MKCFFERYDVIKVLGVGATATVYLAWDGVLSRFVAVKCGTDKKLLLQEARWQSAVPCGYFPAIYDYVEIGVHICLIMENINGENLVQRKQRIGRFTEEEVVAIAMQVAEALKVLHSLKAVLVYSDIKPENIMIQAEGNVRIVDFGAVAPEGEGMGDSAKGEGNVRGGTLRFAAPEQWKELPDIRNDIYGLGCLMKELLMQGGKLCCSGKTRRIIERCMQKQKEGRFRDMEQFISALKVEK